MLISWISISQKNLIARKMNGLQKLQIAATIAVIGFLLWRFGGLEAGLSILPMLIFLLIIFLAIKSQKKNWTSVKKSIVSAYVEQNRTDGVDAKKAVLTKILSEVFQIPQNDQIMKAITGNSVPQYKTGVSVMSAIPKNNERPTFSPRIIATIAFIVAMLMIWLASQFK